MEETVQAQNEVKSALERLIANIATEADRRTVQQAMLTGKIVYTTGDHSVAIGGNATGTVIITGDVFMAGTGHQIGIGNEGHIKFDLIQSAFDNLRNDLFPTPKGCPPILPNLIFLGRETALKEVKSLLGLVGGRAPNPKQAIVRGWPGGVQFRPDVPSSGITHNLAPEAVPLIG